MTRINSRRATVAWASGLVLVLTGMVGVTGTTAAMGADDPTSPDSPNAAATTDSAAPDGQQAAADDPSSASTTPSQTITPSITSEPSATATTTAPPLEPPDHYSPPDGTDFNHPFSSSLASNIRHHVLRTVNSVPSGGSIRLAEFSLNDDRLANALIAAWKRGVAVQIVANNHNWTDSIKRLPPSPSFKRLYRLLGQVRYPAHTDPARASFVRICHASCRGRGGNVHYKLFLFSSAGNKQWVTMMGSPNLTTAAAYLQWNHLDTYSDKATYDYYGTWFDQMKADKPLAAPYRYKKTGAVLSWTFPKYGTTARTDPLMARLNKVHCKGATGGTGIHGRTKIRIGAYTFYENRGRWLSKKVRSLWNAGCDIAIEYAIMGDTVKRTLYSRSGRGRIPMRQVVTFTRKGAIHAYDHAKWIAVSGVYGSDHSAKVVWTGTTNISDLGFRSDDTQQEWFSASRVNAYMNDFYTLWRSRQAHVPSPTSRLGARIGSPGLRLGEGRYASMEPE